MKWKCHLWMWGSWNKTVRLYESTVFNNSSLLYGHRSTTSGPSGYGGYYSGCWFCGRCSSVISTTDDTTVTTIIVSIVVNKENMNLKARSNNANSTSPQTSPKQLQTLKNHAYKIIPHINLLQHFIRHRSRQWHSYKIILHQPITVVSAGTKLNMTMLDNPHINPFFPVPNWLVVNTVMTSKHDVIQWTLQMAISARPTVRYSGGVLYWNYCCNHI